MASRGVSGICAELDCRSAYRCMLRTVQHSPPWHYPTRSPSLPMCMRCAQSTPKRATTSCALPAFTQDAQHARAALRGAGAVQTDLHVAHRDCHMR